LALALGLIAVFIMRSQLKKKEETVVDSLEV